MRVLLVEDDAMIGRAIEDALHDAAYAVDWVRDGHMAETALVSGHYDMVLLDLGLPSRDGLDLLREVRRRGHDLPVLIITARDAVDDRIRGLDRGADDYVSKPFAMSELQARMRALARRRGGSAAAVLSNGVLVLDPATHEVRIGDAAGVRLSRREYALLEALMIRPGAILSRAQLEERIYGWGEEVESNAVEYLIHALRRKLGSDSVRNVRGVGWMVPRGD